MKIKNLLLSFLLVGFVSLSCEKSDIDHSRDFDKSYQKWLEFKEATGNSYLYQVVTSSWVGYSTETTITVEKGEVVQRHYKFNIGSYSDIDIENIPEEMLEWTENGEEVGLHGSESGAALPFTLDEIYSMAPQWLAKRKGVTTIFETEHYGLISSCGYWPENCADDCFVGVHIRFIEAYFPNQSEEE